MAGPATLTQVRNALAAQLTAKLGLRATGSVPGQVNPPEAVVGPAAGRIMAYQTMGNVTLPSSLEWYLRILLLVGSGDDPDAQALLDGYLSPDGASSVAQAVLADPTLGGVVDYSLVTGATGYGLVLYGAVQYLGTSILVTAGCQ